MFSVGIVVHINGKSTMAASVAVQPGAVNGLLDAEVQQEPALLEVLPF